MRTFKACKKSVANRGVAPDSFLNDLVHWGLTAPDEIFETNKRFDVYSSVRDELARNGVWPSLAYRKAVMLEVLRVLAGFESSWDWREGRDIANSNGDKPEDEEAGVFQVSYDSIAFDPSLAACVMRHTGELSPERFISGIKNGKMFAIEYAARLLRFTVRHNGPVKRKEINPWLSREAVNEFLSFTDV